MRLLPAYCIFRQISTSSHTRNFGISYKISSFSDPFSRAEEKMTKEYKSSITNYANLKDNKDDSGRFSGLLSSSGSPRIGFSRSSSKLSLQDDLDEGDFSCPFVVGDVPYRMTCMRATSH